MQGQEVKQVVLIDGHPLFGGNQMGDDGKGYHGLITIDQISRSIPQNMMTNHMIRSWLSVFIGRVYSFLLANSFCSPIRGLIVSQIKFSA